MGSPRARQLALVGVMLTAGCSGSVSEPPDGPLSQTTPETTVIGLNNDAARIQDVDAGIDLANPTDHSIRLLSVSSIRDPASPTPLRVVLFRIAGPGVTDSWSGGIVTEMMMGVPLTPASKAVIPPGAGSDYVILVRYSVPLGTRWARDKGLVLKYSTNGQTYSSVWKRQVSMCSPKAMGRKFCSDLK